MNTSKTIKSLTTAALLLASTAASAGTSPFTLVSGATAPGVDVSLTVRESSVAGYDYDRVRAIMDGDVGLDGSEIRFDKVDVYGTNRAAFGPDRPYEITEIGLVPFIRKYVNEDFRAYSLLPGHSLSVQVQNLTNNQLAVSRRPYGLRPGRPRLVRIPAFVAALACVGYIVMVALRREVLPF